MNTPSVYAHILNGILLFVAAVYLALHASKIVSRNPYQNIVLLLLASIALGIHGLSHLGLESVYNYNPFTLLVGNRP